jgi:ketosteroid isomerase-like protein
MAEPDRLALTRQAYGAYESGERSQIDALLAEDFTFFSPLDDGIDRETYFERCWPNETDTEAFAYKRLIEIGNQEVLVTYELTKTDGKRFCNTEVLKFAGEKIVRVEVYFGWNL